MVVPFPNVDTSCYPFDLVQGNMVSVSKELIDAQFDRAVEIVQSLPKTSPIQTDYDEKLTMYRYVLSNAIAPQPNDNVLF